MSSRAFSDRYPALEAAIAESRRRRHVIATRKATYEASGKALPVEPYSLIEALRQRNDWQELLPFARELFKIEGTAVFRVVLFKRKGRELNDEDALS